MARGGYHVPFFIPYAIASVCSFWRDVASLIPNFWTRMVIFLDLTRYQSAAIKSQLSWSRDLPLDITMSRRTFTHCIVDDWHIYQESLILSIQRINMTALRSTTSLHFCGMRSLSVPSLDMLYLIRKTDVDEQRSKGNTRQEKGNTF